MRERLDIFLDIVQNFTLSPEDGMVYNDEGKNRRGFPPPRRKILWQQQNCA